MDNDIFTAEDVAESNQYLKPSYFAARRVVEEAMKGFTAEALEPLVKTAVDAFTEKLQSDVEDYIWQNAELNLQSKMERMVERTVQALLSGETWALNAYPLAKTHDAAKVREAIAKHIPQELQEARLAELEKEVARLREDLRFYRERP